MKNITTNFLKVKKLVRQNFFTFKKYFSQQFYRHLAVVNLSAAQFKSDKLKIFVDERMNFCGFTSTINSYVFLISKNFPCTSCVLMNFAKNRIHLNEIKIPTRFDQQNGFKISSKLFSHHGRNL